ncbi:penicillin-binding transpeptidase domain-containing protein [Bacillus manliponensis]|uniref:penicillin-binding transpeptidase domain-containing protein n=1 Tax=Bacillus manliponensis TaxID=574376 RepID=UPI003513AC97
MEMKRRIEIILVIGIICMTILFIRLMQIQIVATESFGNRKINLIARSITQRTQTIVIDDGRGRFVDRNGELLNDEYVSTLIVFPFLKITDENEEQIVRIIGKQIKLNRVDEPTVVEFHKKPLSLTKDEMDQINDLRIPGLIAASIKRARNTPLAAHLIGITGENEQQVIKKYGEKIPSMTKIGVSGLQRVFDEFLITDGEEKMMYHVDQRGEPLFGNEVKYTSIGNPFYPVSVVTTIDKELQQAVENIVDRYPLAKGGLVLLDIKTNEILSMVSKPSLQTRNKWGYQKSATNEMLTSHFPGSVFKTVIAAAALDSNINLLSRKFDCNRDSYGESMAQQPMGSLSFHESFARSCNRAFAELTEELIEEDENVVETYAKALGVMGTVGWQGSFFHNPSFRQLAEEKATVIWKEKSDKFSHKATDQTAIGQKNVRLSPLAIANMMATIARDGEKREVKAVKEILYKNGMPLYRFEDHELKGERVGRAAIRELQQLLREVVTNKKGTGAVYNKLPLTVAGKSGTAQTGKGNRVNRWFAGYFPYETPRYVLVVTELETNGERNFVTPIFTDVVTEVTKWEARKE